MRADAFFCLALWMMLPCPVSRADERDERETESENRRPSLAREIGSDFASVFTSPENLVTIGIGGGAAWGASFFDASIASSGLNSESSSTPGLDAAFEAGEVLGGAAVQVGGALAAFGVGKLTGSDTIEDLGRDLIRAQIVTQSLTAGLKTAVGRERPDASNDRSFPSGHASGTFATATVLTRHYGWRVGIPAYAVSAYVAGSRLNEGRHYLSDVVFGAAIGILVGRTVTMDIASRRFAIEPFVVPGGAGVRMTWVPGQGLTARTMSR